MKLNLTKADFTRNGNVSKANVKRGKTKVEITVYHIKATNSSQACVSVEKGKTRVEWTNEFLGFTLKETLDTLNKVNTHAFLTGKGINKEVWDIDIGLEFLTSTKADRKARRALEKAYFIKHGLKVRIF